MLSIRGATTVENDTAEEILQATTELLQAIIRENKLEINRIMAIFFTCTEDLTSVYPAKAARDLGINHASLMCMQEMHVENSLEKCIRTCIFYNEDGNQENVKNVYLRKSQILRPDLVK